MYLIISVQLMTLKLTNSHIDELYNIRSTMDFSIALQVIFSISGKSVVLILDNIA